MYLYQAENIFLHKNGTILDENCSQRTEVKEYTSKADETWEPTANHSSSEDEVSTRKYIYKVQEKYIYQVQETYTKYARSKHKNSIIKVYTKGNGWYKKVHMS